MTALGAELVEVPIPGLELARVAHAVIILRSMEGAIAGALGPGAAKARRTAGRASPLIRCDEI